MKSDSEKSVAVPSVACMELLSGVVRWLKHKLHRCSEPGCWHKGRECYYSNDADSQPDEWICADHAHKAGFCWCCGNFWGGVGSFDFRKSGLCDNCADQLKADMGEYDSDEEAYDFEY